MLSLARRGESRTPNPIGLTCFFGDAVGGMMKNYFNIKETLDYLNKNLTENNLNKEDLAYLIITKKLQPLFYHAGVVFFMGKNGAGEDDYFKGYLRLSDSISEMLRVEDKSFTPIFIRTTYVYEKTDGFIPNDIKSPITVCSLEERGRLFQQHSQYLQDGKTKDDVYTYCYLNALEGVEVSIKEIRFSKKNLDSLLNNDSNQQGFGKPIIGHVPLEHYQQRNKELLEKNEQLEKEIQELKSQIQELEGMQPTQCLNTENKMKELVANKDEEIKQLKAIQTTKDESKLSTREENNIIKVLAVLADIAPKIDLSKPYEAHGIMKRKAELLGISPFPSDESIKKWFSKANDYKNPN